MSHQHVNLLFDSNFQVDNNYLILPLKGFINERNFPQLKNGLTKNLQNSSMSVFTSQTLLCFLFFIFSLHVGMWRTIQVQIEPSETQKRSWRLTCLSSERHWTPSTENWNQQLMTYSKYSLFICRLLYMRSIRQLCMIYDYLHEDQIMLFYQLLCDFFSNSTITG